MARLWNYTFLFGVQSKGKCKTIMAFRSTDCRLFGRKNGGESAFGGEVQT